MDKTDKPSKIRFANELKSIRRWLIQNGKVRPDRPDTDFAAICSNKTSAFQKKTVDRWLAAENLPQNENWSVLKIGLINASIPRDMILALESILTNHYLEEDDHNTLMQNVPAEIQNVRQSSDLDYKKYSYSQDKENEIIRPQYNPQNHIPKLCALLLEVPEQGSFKDDFIVHGEIRFDKAPDVIDTYRIKIGIKRASLLPVETNCRTKPGSLFRPSMTNVKGTRGASHVIFQADLEDHTACLQGDILQGETLGRFVANRNNSNENIRLEIYLQLEDPGDLVVGITDLKPTCSITQKKIAERWIAEKIGIELKSTDGSITLSSFWIEWE